MQSVLLFTLASFSAPVDFLRWFLSCFLNAAMSHFSDETERMTVSVRSRLDHVFDGGDVLIRRRDA